MREIKFRAWEKETKKMHQVVDINFRNYNPGVDVPGSIKDGAEFLPMSYIELMQNTGLKDKNGKEIYEGDLVLISDSENPLRKGVWEVFWISPVFAMRRGKGESAYGFYEDVEVIGNIFENPDHSKSSGSKCLPANSLK